MKIYTTKEYSGYGKHNYYHNEYELEGDEITQYKCHRQKVFDGKENEWHNTRWQTNSWNLSDEDLPDWLREKAEEYQ